MDQLSSAVVGSVRKRRPAGRRPPFECIALLLQGGGALGSTRPAYMPRWQKPSCNRMGRRHLDRRDQRRADRRQCARAARRAAQNILEQITASTHGLDAGLAPLSEPAISCVAG